MKGGYLKNNLIIILTELKKRHKRDQDARQLQEQTTTMLTLEPTQQHEPSGTASAMKDVQVLSRLLLH